MLRFGWEEKSWFGQFVSVAAAVFALAFMYLAITHVLVWRYDSRIASGDLNPPALRSLPDADAVMVLGAQIGDVPDTVSLRALTGALKQSIKSLPWDRALVRRNTHGTLVTLHSVFIPVNGMASAFALCAKLANVPPGCVPAIASSDELRRMDGRAVSPGALAAMGIAPYSEQTRRWPGKVATALPPKIIYVERPAKEQKPAALPTPVHTAPVQMANARVQPPLKLQPGLHRASTRGRDSVYWLSKTYRPGGPGVVSVVAAGDVMMGSISTGLNPAIRPGTDAATLVGSDLANIFRRADIAFANLEGPLYNGGAGSAKSCKNCFSFHSPPYYAQVLANLGIDAVSLANNHSGDYGEAGRLSTMAALRKAGIGFGGLNRDGARAATLILPGGRKAAVVAFAPNSGTLNLNNIGAAQALVRQLKKTHDLVIVSFHGGAEGWAYVHVPKKEEFFYGEDRGNVMRFAHAVIDAGADLVIGQGPHVPRAVEIYRGHLIAYSLGNFWTYSGVLNFAVSGLGPVLEAWLAPNGEVAGFTIHSTRQAGLGVPHLDPLGEAGRYVMYLTKSDFPGSYSRLARASRQLPVAVAGGEGGETPILNGSGS